MIDKKKYTKAYVPFRMIFLTNVVAIPLAPFLAKLKVNPNFITVLSIILGIFPMYFFAKGYWALAVIIFELAFLLDCLDGKIARIRGITSEFGAKLDALGEIPRKPCCFLGIGAYFYLNGQMGFVALTFFVVLVHYGLHRLYKYIGISHYDLEFPDFHKNIFRKYVPKSLNLYNWFEEEFLQFEFFPLIAAIIGLPKGGIWFFYGAGFVFVLGFVKMIISFKHLKNGTYDKIYQDWNGTKGMLDKVVKDEK